LNNTSPDASATLSARTRIAIVVIVAIYAAILAWPSNGVVGSSDFSQLWYAARAQLGGGDAYGAVGPGRSFDWPFPLFYPLPAVLVAVPFTIVSSSMASVLFSAISAAALAWVFSRNKPYRLLGILSFSFYYAAAISQWSPVLIAAAMIPSLGFLFAVKPTIGLALWLYRPSWQAVVGSALLLIVSLLVSPGWPSEWIGTFGAGPHIRAPITTFGGLVVLIALFRWRRPEARLLVALACVPHTTLLYEALPLFLIPASWREAALLLALNWAAELTLITLGPYPSLLEKAAMSATLSVAFLYLPCAIMILRRANEGELPEWMPRVLLATRSVLPGSIGARDSK
jgi:hypothetical protein